MIPETNEAANRGSLTDPLDFSVPYTAYRHRSGWCSWVHRTSDHRSRNCSRKGDRGRNLHNPSGHNDNRHSTNLCRIRRLLGSLSDLRPERLILGKQQKSISWSLSQCWTRREVNDRGTIWFVCLSKICRNGESAALANASAGCPAAAWQACWSPARQWPKRRRRNAPLRGGLIGRRDIQQHIFPARLRAKHQRERQAGRGDRRWNIRRRRLVTRAIGVELENRIIDRGHVARGNQYLRQSRVRTVESFWPQIAGIAGLGGATDLSRWERRVQAHQRVKVIF